MYSAAFLKEKLPFETGKQYMLAREKIWKKIDKSIPNYIKVKEAKKFIKTTINIPFKYDQKQEDQQIIAGYDYAKNLLTPLKQSDPRFAEQTVSKSEFKYFLRHMRLYYETLFAWKKFQSTEENSISVDKLRKVVEKLKTWGHLYLNGWDVEKIMEEFGSDGAFSLKQLIRFVFTVATKFEYNKQGQDNHVEHVENEQGQNEQKSITNGSRSQVDKNERMSVGSEQLIDLTKAQRQQKEEQQIQNQEKPVTPSSQTILYTDNQQQRFYQPFGHTQDLHHQRIKYSYVDLFQMAKECFYAKDYEEGLNLINQCIEIDPRNSILYSNRALFYTQVQLIEYAFADLFSALELNHLNYIAYFNMFSLLTRQQKHDQAFDNLSCALSCLYLIKAKTTKSQIDAAKAIKYAQNNIEAHVLKAMMHLENGKLKLALNELNWACEINPKLLVLKNVRNFVMQKLSPEEQLEQYQQINDQEEQGFIRLEGSYQIEQEADRGRQIDEKISEFNRLYNDLKASSEEVRIFAKTTTFEKIPSGKEEENEKGSFTKDLGSAETLEPEIQVMIEQ